MPALSLSCDRISRELAMQEIERVCPNCGSTNPYVRSQCVRCGANLTNLPARSQLNSPARFEGAGTAALVLAASAFIARAGLRLFVRQVLPRFAKGLQPKPASLQTVDQAPEEQPGLVIRGWRAWHVRSGTDRSSGSEHFEWRITRDDEPSSRRSR